MACIMQRYFNQIRSKGLFIMNKAYTTIGGKTVPVPLSDIAILFAIDDLDEVIIYCPPFSPPPCHLATLLPLYQLLSLPVVFLSF